LNYANKFFSKKEKNYKTVLLSVTIIVDASLLSLCPPHDDVRRLL